MDSDTKTTKYMVYFTYTIVVDSEDYETAEDLAHDEFAKTLAGGLSAGDFAISDAEDVSDWWRD